MVFLFLFFLCLFFIILFFLINLFFSYSCFNYNKVSSFESGFCSVGLIQNSFSIHFFVIMVMFVVFDLEIVMFLGIIISDLNSFFVFFLLFLFIMGGFYLEWWYGKLLWVS